MNEQQIEQVMEWLAKVEKIMDEAPILGLKGPIPAVVPGAHDVLDYVTQDNKNRRELWLRLQETKSE